MAIPHARPGEPLEIRPLGAELPGSQTTTLIKTDSLEVIRLVVPAGKEIAEHRVPGEITVQCIEGKVAFHAGEAERELTGGTLMYLAGSTPHSLRGIEDASLLLTILLR